MQRTRTSVNRGHLTSVFSGQLTSALTTRLGAAGAPGRWGRSLTEPVEPDASFPSSRSRRARAVVAALHGARLLRRIARVIAEGAAMTALHRLSVLGVTLIMVAMLGGCVRPKHLHPWRLEPVTLPEQVPHSLPRLRCRQ